ncbi:MAG: 2-dehydropantoate 2-reductase [Betaproteobacteria bacterium]|nr:MAG: 2-dehydropantoate 2-reductase [Betaproteobacteria bacterium]
MAKHIAIIGAGAVGGYVGGHLTRGGEDVSLVDPWAEHVETMRSEGLSLSGTQGEHRVEVNALHISDVQQFVRKPVDIAIICTKSYDTEWAATMIRQYLAPDGYGVSMQNGINEERLAGVLGWGRTLGCVVSTISVNAFKAGRIMRYQQPGGDKHTVFRVGEVHGRVTPRATELAKILSAVDSADVTTNLWGERWTKLTANTITHGLLGATGLDNRVVYLERGKMHRLGVKLAAEAIEVGRAHGFQLGTVLGIEPDAWLSGARRDPAGLRRLDEGLRAWMATLIEPSRSSVGRDVMRGRRSEIDFTNGLVAEKAAEIGVPAPTHAAVTELVRRIDRGTLKPDPSNVDAIPD